MGYICPPRQRIADFLTSLTNPHERIVAPGFESKVPRTPDEFAREWALSQERRQLLDDIEVFEEEYPLDGRDLEQFEISRKAQQTKHS